MSHDLYWTLGFILVLALLGMILKRDRSLSESLGVVLYWIGFGLLLTAALLGTALFGALMAIAFTLIVVFGLLLAVGFLPLVVWVALFDQAKTVTFLSEIKKAINAPSAGN